MKTLRKNKFNKNSEGETQQASTVNITQQIGVDTIHVFVTFVLNNSHPCH